MYALKFCEEFEAGSDIEILLYLRPEATIILDRSVRPSGKLGAG
jgi:hypothetical protein